MILNVDALVGTVTVMTAAGDTKQVECPSYLGSIDLPIPPGTIYRVSCGLLSVGTLIVYLDDMGDEINVTSLLGRLLTLKIVDYRTTSLITNVIAQAGE